MLCCFQELSAVTLSTFSETGWNTIKVPLFSWMFSCSFSEGTCQRKSVFRGWIFQGLCFAFFLRQISLHNDVDVKFTGKLISRRNKPNWLTNTFLLFSPLLSTSYSCFQSLNRGNKTKYLSNIGSLLLCIHLILLD